MIKKITATISLILFIAVSFLPAASGKPDKYVRAVEAYKKEKHKEAIKGFKSVIKKYPATKWEYYSRLYTARCWRKTGDDKKALKELQILLKKTYDGISGEKDAVIEEIGKVANTKAVHKLKELLKSSKVPQVRKKAAQVIADINARSGIGKIRPDFMFDVLKSETEIEVSKEISRAIYKMGDVGVDKLIKIYRKADSAFKKKLLYLMSQYEDEDLIMALQNDVGKSQFRYIKNYISWALAKMDPYRFAVKYKGKLRKEPFEDQEERYYIYTRSGKFEILEPSQKSSTDVELEKLNDREVYLYGVEKENGIIYTEVFATR
jgi:hypothetical protein